MNPFLEKRLEQFLQAAPAVPPNPEALAKFRGKLGAYLRLRRRRRLGLLLTATSTLTEAAEVGAGSEVFNVFCPTGKGGGVDPTCSPGGKAGARTKVRTAHRLKTRAGSSSVGGAAADGLAATGKPPSPAAAPAAPGKPVKYRSGAAAEKDLAKSAEQWAEDPSDYFGNRAVKAYAGTSDSFRINDCLRNDCDDPRLKGKADALASVLDRASFPKDVAVARSINAKTPAERQELLEKFRSNLGKEFTDPAFVSTTANHDYADEWAKKFGADAIRVNVHVPKGAKAAYIPKEIAGHQEWEVLVQRGSKFRVRSVEGSNVELELL